MALPGATPITKATDSKEKKKPTHRVRSPVEVASAKVMNLIGRLPDADQRKVIQTVTALTSKGD